MTKSNRPKVALTCNLPLFWSTPIAAAAYCNPDTALTYFLAIFYQTSLRKTEWMEFYLAIQFDTPVNY